MTGSTPAELILEAKSHIREGLYPETGIVRDLIAALEDKLIEHGKLQAVVDGVRSLVDSAEEDRRVAQEGSPTALIAYPAVDVDDLSDILAPAKGLGLSGDKLNAQPRSAEASDGWIEDQLKALGAKHSEAAWTHVVNTVGRNYDLTTLPEDFRAAAIATVKKVGYANAPALEAELKVLISAHERGY